MKIRITPAARISFGLLMLTLSILLLSDWFGLIPDARSDKLEQRKNFSESLAVQFSSLAQGNDIKHIETTLQAVVNRNDDIISAAFVSLDGGFNITAGEHEKYWKKSDDADYSSFNQVLVPILKGDSRWGSVQIRFASEHDYPFAEYIDSSFLLLILFVSVSGFFLYMVFLKRVIKELDPSQVVPSRVKNAFDSLAEGVVILDEKGDSVMINRAFAESASLDMDKLLGLNISDMNWSYHQERKALNKEALPWMRTLNSGKGFTGYKISLHKDADISRSYTINCSAVQDEKGNTRGAVVTFDDLTELEKKHERLQQTLKDLKKSKSEVDLKSQELEYLATRDPLTNCLNRRALNEQFEAMFEVAVTRQEKLICLMVDIDHFKRVNDNYGHAIGDKIIKFVADTLKKNIRSQDLLSRYGGEEFCVILSDSTIDQAINIAERMRAAIKRGDPTRYTSALNVTASFGIATLDDDISNKDDLLINADKALYQAKEGGRNKVVVWNKDTLDFDDETGAHKLVERPIRSFIGEDSVKTTPEIENRLLELERIAKEKAEQLDWYVTYDHTTDLPTRNLFIDRIEQALQRARRNNRVLAVLSLGLENLSRINDMMGFENVEEVIRETTIRLQKVLRSSDTIQLLASSGTETTISRLNEAEFGLLLPEVKDHESITWVISRIFEALGKPIFIEGHNINITCNIGVGVFPADAVNAVDLIKNASIARFYAEQLPGKNNLEFFSEDINRISREQLLLESQLAQAINNDELVLHYQPKINLHTGSICGFEALIRWRHPTRGILTPYEFIGIAERTGLINPIGEWVMKTACKQLATFKKYTRKDITISVNVSATQFAESNIADRFIRLAEQANISPSLLEIEITESCLMENMDTAIATLEKLQDHGVKIAIDDFGTGYSGLSYLRTLPIDMLKVDRCFIGDVDTNPNDTAIVKAIVNIAKALGLKVVAEGIETQTQLNMLTGMSCDEAQGYLFSRPVPDYEAISLLSSLSDTRVPATDTPAPK